MMKRLAAVLLLLMSVLSCACAQAACQHTSMPGYDMIWYEGFEGAGMPSGWQTLDQDGDGYNWERVHQDDSLWGTSFLGMQCDGDGLAVSASYINENGLRLTPDNWLILPVQDIGRDYHLTFRVQAQDDNYSDDCYGVFVSTDVSHPLDTSSYVQLGSDALSPDDYETVDIDLSAYEGKQILIAIRHYNSYDMFVMNFDCFTMWGMKDEAAAVSAADLPQTGDSSSLALWGALLALTGAGMMVARKREA